MKVALIVAAAANNVIGRDNQLPWHLPQDLKYFKAKTMGKPIIMGRKTFDSIGRPLPGRINIVVTRNRAWSAAGVSVVTSVHDALQMAQQLVVGQDVKEVMVIGGAEIYQSALPLADKVYLTRIDLAIEGDAYFPDLDAAEWHLTESQEGDEEGISHRFLVYERAEQEIVANN